MSKPQDPENNSAFILFAGELFFQEAYHKKYGQLKMQVFQPRLAKYIIDEIDTVLANHYGFTDEELDFIIN